MDRRRCWVFGCGARGGKMYHFPRPAERAMQWKEFCRNPKLEKYDLSQLHNSCCVCEKHFDVPSFTYPSSHHLLRSAVPTLFPPSNPLDPQIEPLSLTSPSRLCEAHFTSNQFEFNRERGIQKLKPNAVPTIFSHSETSSDEFPSPMPGFPVKASTIEQGLSAAVRVTAEIEDDSQADLQSEIPTERNASTIEQGPSAAVRVPAEVEDDSQEDLQSDILTGSAEGPQLINQEITRQSDSLTNVPQSNRPIDIQIGQEEFHMIEETSEMYSLITLPYLELADPNLQWVYRILSGEEVCERIVYQSPEKDDKNGFLLIKDSKWDGSNLDKLHLIAIAYRPGIMSLRDLGAEHLCLLQNIYSSGKAVIMEKYGVLGTRLCIFIEYAPDFYHLHVHFTAVNDVSGPHFVTAHPLHSVIQNIQVFPKYYQAATLGLRFKESDKLFQEFEARGLVERIRPLN